MSFTFTRPAGIWASNSVLLSSEMASFDANMVKAVDGVGGGTYSNTAELRFTGATGVYPYVLKAGGSGTPTMTHSGTTTALTNGNNITGNISLDNAVTFAAGGSAILAGTTSVTGAATVSGAGLIALPGNKFDLNDDTTPDRTGNLGSNGMVRVGSVNYVGTNSIDLFNGLFNFVGTPNSVERVFLDLHLNYNVRHDTIAVTWKASALHSSISGMTFPTANLYSVDIFGALTLLSTITLSAASNAAYIAGATTIFAFTAFRPTKIDRYKISISNESSTNSIAGFTVQGISWTGLPQKFGNTGEY